MTREKFTFYGSWLDAVGHLSGELRGEVLTAIVEYGLYGETNSARGSVTKAILELVKPQIDRDRTLYENGCQGGRPKNQTETNPEPDKNQTETNPEPDKNQTETNPEPRPNQTETKTEPDETKAEPRSSRARAFSLSNVCVNNNISTQEEKKEEESKEKESAEREGKAKTVRRFSRPTVEDVQAYCTDRGNNVDAQAFCDFYESKGWMVGSNPMKDWKAAVRTWENRREYRQAAPAQAQESVYEQNARLKAEYMRKFAEANDK